MTPDICKVLLVDDDEDDYIVARDLLDESEQLVFKLTWVDNYEDGLTEISKNLHDIYLLNFRLGRQNGLELLQAAIAIGCQKPIILLTGVGDHAIDQKAMNAGASDYLVKGSTLSATLLERSIIHAFERKRSEMRQAELLTEVATANQELKDFAYIISHDLKAPLRGISSIAGWLSQDYADMLGDEGKEMLQLMSGRVRRMSDLIDGVLQYSRLGHVREEKREINLNTLVLEIIDLLAAPVGIKIAIATDLPTIEAEQTRIQQVFQNLISNAIKYMDKPSGEIRIGHTLKDGFWEFYVSDTGIGIEDRYFDKVFQIFQTLYPPDQSDSTGVGLAIVKKVIEMYGGQIWVTSEINIGSTFWFTIPISEIEGINHEKC